MNKAELKIKAVSLVNGIKVSPMHCTSIVQKQMRG